MATDTKDVEKLSVEVQPLSSEMKELNTHNNPDLAVLYGLSDQELALNLSAFTEKLPSSTDTTMLNSTVAVQDDTETEAEAENGKRIASPCPSCCCCPLPHCLTRKRLVIILVLFVVLLVIAVVGVLFNMPPSSPPSIPILPPPPSNVTVGVYYYPWHSRHFYKDQYLRRFLDQLPALGEYDDSDPGVIAQHLRWSRQSNIRLWVTSWWGPGRVEDVNLRQTILPHPELGNHQIGLFYETLGRIPDDDDSGDYDLSNVEPDILYLCQEYFGHPNYFRIDGRPVLFLYLSRKLEALGILPQVTGRMRAAAGFCGEDIHLIGDHVWGDAPDEPDAAFEYLDGVTNYDIYGNLKAAGLYATKREVDRYYDRLQRWKSAASAGRCALIPSVTPGFNKNGRTNPNGFPPLARRMDGPAASSGSLFRYSLFRARYLVDPSVRNLLLVTSFNEWGEDTQIEPVEGASTTPDATNVYTEGVVYEGYGDLYLRILRNGTVDLDEEDAEGYANFDY